jgi:hypothetical protein
MIVVVPCATDAGLRWGIFEREAALVAREVLMMKEDSNLWPFWSRFPLRSAE